MSRFYDEFKEKSIRELEILCIRKRNIQAIINCNSPAALFRELNTLTYKILIAELHIKGTFGKDATAKEYSTRPI